MDTTRIQQSLDGDWQLVLDPQDAGIREEWFQKRELPDAIDVRVPSVWDLWVPDYDGVGWYFRDVTVGPEWDGRYVELQFEAADYYAEVWLNGTRLGDHEGGYTPFAFNVTDILQQGTNRLAVRIIDPHGEDGWGIYGYREFPSAKETGYWSFGGLWGSVSLVGKPKGHLVDVFVQPDIRRKRITVAVETSSPGTVQLCVAGTDYHIEGEPGTLNLEMPEFELWSPESPHLYTLECVLLEDGAPVDTLSVRFGMREFGVRDNRFFLNNHPYFVRGVLHQPDYARSLAAPETPELARRELELAKEASFNMVRLHIKTAPKITLELADEIGLLLYEEPPIGWIKKSEYMQERCEREVREMILRDRDHPSVVIWGMLNETGNAKYVVNGGAQVIKDDLGRLARSLDPTRLIIDDSGGTNATREPARFMRPFHDELERYDDLHIYQRAPVDRDIERFFMFNGNPNELYFLSEFGFGGMEDLDATLAEYGEDRERLKDARFLDNMATAAKQGFEERGLDRIFGDFPGFCRAAQELQSDAIRYQFDAIRANQKVSGYCYTQLCDAGHEFCAGMLDRWRRPKDAFKTLQEAQADLRPVILFPRTNLVPREEVPVTVLLLNEHRLEGRADLSLQVIGPTNQVLWKKKRNVKIPRSGKELWTGSVSASGSSGTHKFAVRLMQGMKVLAENAVELHVFDPVEPCDVEINVVDPNGDWTRRCTRLAKQGSVRAPIHIVPPLGNTVRAYPDNEMAHVMAEVQGGAVAIVFGPPDDWNDWADKLDDAVCATGKDGVGSFLGLFHYAKLHPVFDSLPNRQLMRQPYRNIVPPKTFLETSDEDICGSFDTGPIAAGNYMIGQTQWWGSNILVRRYGTGRVVFTHLRVLDHLGSDPVADRLFVNLLKHFSRRSVPTDATLPIHQPAVEWLRKERDGNTRRWMVLGMFANWSDEGHDKPYPPETKVDFDAAYPGWYKPIVWQRWYSRGLDDHVVDLQAAFSPVYQYYPRFDHGTGYAYAEVTSEKRQPAILKMQVQDFTKVWLNGRLVFEYKKHLPHLELDTEEVDVMLKQGRNTILVKVSKIPGEMRFGLDLASPTRFPLVLKWWK